jgi:hypothetical protein
VTGWWELLGRPPGLLRTTKWASNEGRKIASRRTGARGRNGSAADGSSGDDADVGAVRTSQSSGGCVDGIQGDDS